MGEDPKFLKPYVEVAWVMNSGGQIWHSVSFASAL